MRIGCPHRACKRRVGESDAQIAIHGEHAFHHAGQYRFALRRFHTQRSTRLRKLRGGGVQRPPQRAQLIIGIRQGRLGKVRLHQSFRKDTQPRDAHA